MPVRTKSRPKLAKPRHAARAPRAVPRAARLHHSVRAPKKKYRSAATKKARSPKWVAVLKHGTLWLAAALLIGYLIYIVFMPMLLVYERLSPENAASEQVLLLSGADRDFPWLAIYIAPQSVDGFVGLVSLSETELEQLRMYPLDGREREDLDEEVDRIAVLRGDDDVSAMSFNQGVAIASTLRSELDLDGLSFEQAAGLEMRGLIAAQIRSALIDLSWSELHLWTRIWFAFKANPSIQTYTATEYVQQLQIARTASGTAPSQDCQLAILNGTDVAGVSTRFSEVMTQQQIPVVRIGQAEEAYAQSRLDIDPAAAQACRTTIALIKQFLPAQAIEFESIESSKLYRAPLVVFLGSDVVFSQQ